MKIEDMVPSCLYKLRETVENEHQDHLFTYPAGLIVRLEYIGEEMDSYNDRCVRNEDGEHMTWDTRRVKVCHFEIPTCGMFYVFDPENLDPATYEELAKSKLKATYERMF